MYYEMYRLTLLGGSIIVPISRDRVKLLVTCFGHSADVVFGQLLDHTAHYRFYSWLAI